MINLLQGANVREKAKVVLVLMEDDEKLKEERDFAVKTREKTSKGSAGELLATKPCYDNNNFQLNYLN